MKPRFFAAPGAFREWLERHHDTEPEIWVGFYKVKSGKGGMVYRQALDEALCYGWIDGLVRSVDEECYAQRFTPRKERSNWSLVNIRRAKELIAEGLMQPSGLAAFERRDEAKAAAYSFEQKHVRLPPAYRAALEADAAAHAFFRSQPASYRRIATWWVMSAKRPATREGRLAKLIAESAAGRRLGAAT
jgi:uncharacterized protein YdeI (YjbR/CyaY-like superfamily)